MKKMERQYKGGVVDEYLPERCVALIQQLPGDTKDIKDRIGVLLGRYRDWRKFNETEPPTAETISHVQSLAKQAQRLKPQGEGSGQPRSVPC